MNKRIKELAEQAELNVTLLIDQDKLENFAELFVKDVIDEICEQMDKHNIDMSNLPAWYKAMEATEKHFGVK